MNMNGGTMSAVRLFSVFALLVLVAGCVYIPGAGSVNIRGSGNTVTKDYDLAGFTRVAAGSAFQVEVNQGEQFAVAITVDDNLVEHLDVEKSGDTLRIYLQPRVSLSFTRITLKASVTMPKLEGLELSGATRTVVSGFESEGPLDVEVSGASTLRGDIGCDRARIEASGASTVELEGAATDANLEASGASTLRLDDFPVTNANVNVSGASRANVNVSGKLNGEASGASTVQYTGNPSSVKVNTSGASSVREK